MKFSLQMSHQMVPEWKDHYVNYSQIKRRIKRLEVSVGVRPLDISKKWAKGIGDPETEKNNFIEFITAELDKASQFVKTLVPNANDPTALNSYLIGAVHFVELNREAIRKAIKKARKSTNLPGLDGLYNHIKRNNFFFTTTFPFKKALLTRGILVEHEPFDDAPVSASAALLLLAALVLFCFIIVSGYQPIQLGSGNLTWFLQQAGDFQWFSILVHRRISSLFWVYLSCVMIWTSSHSGSRTERIGAHCFYITTVTFVVKSLVKNILRVPRMFWLYEEDDDNDMTYLEKLMKEPMPFYCGKGYGFPSGHAMVSLACLAYLCVKARGWTKPLIITITVLYECFMCVNVMYIGTHTVGEVLGGWLFALLLVALFLRFESRLFSWTKHASSHLFFSCFMLIVLPTALTWLADYWEDTLQGGFSHMHDADEWMKSMERLCHKTHEEVLRDIQLRMRFTNTPIIFGLTLAYMAWGQLRPDSPISSWPLYCRAKKLVNLTKGQETPSYLWIVICTMVSSVGFELIEDHTPKVLKPLVTPLWCFIGWRVFIWGFIVVLETLFGPGLEEVKKKKVK